MDMDNTTQTSDALIFKALKNAQKMGNPLLEMFDIRYPSENALKTESNSIFVGTVSNDFDKRTMNSEHYNALTEVYIKTKQADYLEVSRILKTAVRVVKKVIREDETLRLLKPTFRKNTNDYGSKFSLKATHLLVECQEHEYLDVPDKELKKICKMIAKINEESYHGQERKKRGKRPRNQGNRKGSGDSQEDGGETTQEETG